MMIVLKYASTSALDGHNQDGILWGWFKEVFNLIYSNALVSPPVSPSESDWEHPDAVGGGFCVVFAFQFEFITFAKMNQASVQLAWSHDLQQHEDIKCRHLRIDRHIKYEGT